MRYLPLVLALLLAFPVPGPAQDAQAAAVVLALESPADGRVRAILGPVLGSPGIRNSLERGLPVRIRLVTQLWRERVLDAQEGRHEWRASVWRDALGEGYQVETANGETLSAASLEEVSAFLAGGVLVPLRPDRPGRYYYLARIEVETLSASDLAELRRWLQGDVAPAVEGGGELGSALGRGLQRLFIRILGLPAERYEARSRVFDYPG